MLRKEVARVTELCAQADVLIGVGGGKTLDTIKFAANRLTKPLHPLPDVCLD